MNLLDDCPKCGCQWSAPTKDGQTAWPGVDTDSPTMVVCKWGCRGSWERGDASIYKPRHDTAGD